MVLDNIHIEFEMEQELSPECKKISTEYYELLLQVRFTYYKDYKKIKQEIAKKIYKNFNTINKVTEFDDSIDIYFRDKNEINKITKIFTESYFCDIKRSKKIVGRNFLEFKDIWRHTLSVNIINLKSGNKISVKGKEYTIKGIKGKELSIIEEITGSKKIFNYNIVKDYINLIE